MIQRSIPTCQDLSWQEELKQLITEPETLFELLDLPLHLLAEAKRAAQLFPLRTTGSFISRIEHGKVDDPLLKQILPLGAEFTEAEGYSTDPLEEAEANPIKGLIHKYHGRVLLISTTSCAINCRYCFRRSFDYRSNRMSKADWQNIFSYLRNDTQINEVIFSGGDPLLQTDTHYAWVIQELEKIPHIKRLRVHSRLPIVLPSRVTPALIKAFEQSRFQSIWVVHCNHAKEIDAQVSEAFKSISQSSITLLNQAVLLKGINDDVHTQVALSEALFAHRVMPYYLHLLDKVSGASHFDIPETQAKQLHQDMAARLPGYLLPKLVKEEAGKLAKSLI